MNGVIANLYGATPKEMFMQSQTMDELTREEAREKFIDQFFQYGIIEDLLKEPEVEDIIINSLNPIYVHHTYRGLIKTDKQFVSQKELEVFIKKLIIFSGRNCIKKLNNL